MNKLFKTIVGAALGLTMAIGVGVAASAYHVENRVVEATTGSVSIDFSTTNDIVAGYVDNTGSFAHTSNNVTATITLTKNDGTKVTNYYPGASTPRTETRFYNKNSVSISAKNSSSVSMYITSIEFICSSHTYATSLASQTITNGSASIHSSGNTETQVDISCDTNVKSISLTSNATIGLKSAVIYWNDTAVANPTVTSVTASAGSLVGTYKGDAYIQCSAVVSGTNNPSQNVTWTLNTTNTYVNQTSVDGASIDSNGKVSFTKNVSVYAFASSNVPNYTDKRGSILCTASNLLDPVDYIKLDRTSRLTAGMNVIIANSAGTYALSTTQGNNNRPAVEISTNASNVAKIIPTKVQVLTLVAGTTSGTFSFSYDDGGTTKYLYAAGTGGNSYLRTTTTKTANASFNITISASIASIVCVDPDYNGVMQYNNGSKLFSCYATASQTALSIYMVGNSLPAITDLTAISNASIAKNISVGQTTTVTASYLPANATEMILVNKDSGAGAVTFGAISMNNGTVTFNVTGQTAGELTIKLKAEDHESINTTLVITIGAYVPTHTKLTSTGGLYNGARVLIAHYDSGTEGLVGKHTGGNNLPTGSAYFGNSGANLSNAEGNGMEFVLWNLTIKDFEDQDVTGWAFYADGYFLTFVDTSNNYIRRTRVLSSLCLFDITYSNGDASLVAADTHVERKVVALNGAIFGAYAALGDYKLPELYIENTVSSNSIIAAGYEDAFLKMDAISKDDKGTGLCTTNNYYSFAKEVYNNTLTSAVKGELSEDAIERLQAWAEANNDVLAENPGTIVAKGLSVMSSSPRESNSTATIVIIFISTIAIGVFGAYFVSRKRKEQ